MVSYIKLWLLGLNPWILKLNYWNEFFWWACLNVCFVDPKFLRESGYSRNSNMPVSETFSAVFKYTLEIVSSRNGPAAVCNGDARGTPRHTLALAAAGKDCILSHVCYTLSVHSILGNLTQVKNFWATVINVYRVSRCNNVLNIFSSISVSIYFSAKYYLLIFLIILITILGIH